MKPIGAPTFDIKTTAANAAWRARALQKPKAAADLDGKSQGEPQQPARQGHNEEAQSSRQNGTETRVPFRHASPRLTAAFTAQLLGQLLPDPERPSSSVRGYGGERLALLPLFDNRL